ncbi:PAS domain-containing protein, partial [bacterium]|nr:PAS domain-containing protein [bacterium]
ETEPALGWAYASFLQSLADDPSMDGAELAQAIVDSYIEQDGRIIGAVCQCRDITERKRMEEKLRISEARYRTLFSAIRYEVYSLDLNGRYGEANAAFHEVWGSCFGRTIEEVIKDPGPAQRLKDLAAQVVKTRTTAQTSFSFVRDRNTLSYIATLSPVLTEDDQLIGLVGVNIDVTEQVAMYDDLRNMSLRMAEIQEKERRRIARDIHDSLGQHLTALQYELAAVVNSFAGQGDPPAALINAETTIKELITLAQNICYDLRPSILDDFGLEVAIQDQLRKYQDKWNLDVSFSANGLDPIKGSSVETVLFRVTQEALTNIFKHAKARRVRIHVENQAGQVSLTIEDDGCGFNTAAAKATSGSAHHGLRNMEERVRLHGGRFSLMSEPGQGARLTAVLPVETNLS